LILHAWRGNVGKKSRPELTVKGCFQRVFDCVVELNCLEPLTISPDAPSDAHQIAITSATMGATHPPTAKFAI
jgi:hypothetical protein